MKSIAMLALCLAVFLGLSSPGPAGAEQPGDLSFQVLSHYFVKNTYAGKTNPSYLLVYDYPSFDALLGLAAVMSADPVPSIDETTMKDRFVVSVVYQGRDIRRYTLDNIILENQALKIYYRSAITQENAAWTCNCHLTVLVAKCRFDRVEFFENGRPCSDATVSEIGTREE